MHEHDHEHEQGGEHHQTPEKPEASAPRVYVASLADYNAGRLHGEWIILDGDADDLHQRVQAMLGRSPEPIAEEWAIHDYEGFGPLALHEYESLDALAALAEGIREHGAAFAHWAALAGPDTEDLLKRFADAYLGHWETVEAFAENLFDDFGYQDLLDQAIPEQLQAYVTLDAAAFARDLQLGGDITTSEGDGGVYVFNAHG